MSPNFFLTSSIHVPTLSTIAHSQPCTIVVFVKLVREEPSHHPRKTVFWNFSVADVNEIITFIHELTISRKKSLWLFSVRGILI